MSAAWSVYILRCRGNRLYTGISTDVARRYQQHRRGVGAKFTRAHPPEAMLGHHTCASRGEALALEYRIKQLTAEAKLSLTLTWQDTQAAKSESDSLRRHASPAASSPQ